MMNHPQPTPIEKLLAEKQQVQEACRKQEEKLNQTFAFIQANAGSLLLSGFSSLLFPAKPKGKNQTESCTRHSSPDKQATALGLFLIGKSPATCRLGSCTTFAGFIRNQASPQKNFQLLQA